MHLRKARSKQQDDTTAAIRTTTASAAVEQLLHSTHVQSPKNLKMLLVTGSGLSASSGLSTFTGSKGNPSSGLYAAARSAVPVSAAQSSVAIFSGDVFRSNRLKSLHFFADLAQQCEAAPTPNGTACIALLERYPDQLVRHLTMNIDGLHRRNCSLWPKGLTVELHGSILETACEACRMHYDIDIRAFRIHRETRDEYVCPNCNCNDSLRPRILLYNDHDETLIEDTSYSEEDLYNDCESGVICVIWIGLSFKQRASADSFDRINRFVKNDAVVHIFVNPEATEMLTNLTDTIQRDIASELYVHLAEVSADSFLQELAFTLQNR